MRLGPGVVYGESYKLWPRSVRSAQGRKLGCPSTEGVPSANVQRAASSERSGGFDCAGRVVSAHGGIIAWVVVLTVACIALAGSLFLTWYSGVDDSGQYSASGWTALDGLDVMLAGCAAVAGIAGLLSLEAPQWVSGTGAVVTTIGLVATVVALRAVVGHSDTDGTLATPEIGVFVALGASVLIGAAGLALSVPHWSHAGTEESGNGLQEDGR
jgi:hypothetical protein